MFPYPILELGDLKVYMYGLMLMIGIICCFLVLFSYCKKLGVSNRTVDFVFYDGIFSIVIGFIGSAAWQGVYNYIDDLNKYGSAQFSLTGGITAIGGLVTGAVCFIIVAFAFRKRYPFVLNQVITIAPCCMVIAHGFGRLGCFCAGCCYGKEATGFFSFLGVTFHQGSPAYSAFGGAAVYPTQLFEAIFLFILFGILSYMCLKKKYYYNLILYIVLYSVWRFLIEFLRADDRGAFVGSLSPSQTQSLILLGVAVIAFFVMKYVKKKELIYLSAQAQLRAEKAELDSLNEANAAQSSAAITGDNAAASVDVDSAVNVKPINTNADTKADTNIDTKTGADKDTPTDNGADK